jgi:membrane-associated phospholipid phosphatase
VNARRGRGAEIALLFGQGIRTPGVRLQATDALVITTVLLFAALAAAFHARVPSAGTLLARTIGSGAVYLGLTAIHQRLDNRHLRFLLRTATVQLAYAQLFLLVLPLQLTVVHTWQDPVVLELQHAVFGVQPVVWLQRFISPALTEWLRFSSVASLSVYPVLGAIIFYGHGERAMEDYLFTVGLANVVCDLGFLVFPVASPYYYQPVRELLTVPLKGGFFTLCGEYIRTHIHRIGGSLPSPHCAVATAMWLMAWRYSRPAFFVLGPVIVSLYVSTFFLRYHYVSDSVVGIVAGIVAVLAVPAAMRIWNRGAARMGAVLTCRS